MTPERWARIKSIVEAVEATPLHERGASLDRLCDGDAALRAEIEPYLAEDGAGTFIRGMIGEQAASLNQTAGRQERFGRYRLVSLIGQGGMGAVYEAARVDDFRKKVALKIIRQGLDSDFARARFLQERQTLAGLEHPYIARLLDGGESNDGSPWLVMEFVEGRPIHEHCAKLDRADRLRLFLKVCEAVGHAHRNLVIHRDLKPANILVTAAGEPKLLDFGIAKLLDPASTRTQTGMAALTPDYASPEQVRGQAISTATDVYSLGLILYELLTGRKPYELGSASALEMDRAICTEPPAPPRLGDELDHILLMALRKEPERRYAGVERFADDIERYLEHRPVRARPDTLRYRAAKFARRNWVGTAAAFAIASTLAIGLGINIAEQRRTSRRFNQVRQLANRFLFDFHDAIADTPGTVKAREMVVSTALQYLNSLADDAKGDPELQWELAMAYAKVARAQGSTTTPSLHRPAEGFRSFQKAIAIGRPVFETNGLNAARRESFVSLLCDAEAIARSLGRADASALGREALSKSAGVSAYVKARALGELALTQSTFGDLTGAEATIEKVLIDSRAAAAREPTFENRRRVGVTLTNLGGVQARLTDFPAANASVTEGLAILRGLAAERPDNATMRRWIFIALSRLGDFAGAGDLPSLGRFEEAADRYEEAIATMTPLIAADSRDRASRNDVGLLHDRIAYALADSDPARALPHAARAAELLDEASPENTDTRAQTRIIAGNALRALRQFPAAEKKLNEAGRILVNNENDTRADLELAWARLEMARGDRERAAAHFDRALAIDERLYGAQPTPANAWALARTLEFAARATPASAPVRRARSLAVWMDQRNRYPKHPYLEERAAEAKALLARR